MKHPDVKAVIFDFGNVISRPQDSAAVSRMAEILGVSHPDFLPVYMRERHEYDRGVLSDAEYWNKVYTSFPVKGGGSVHELPAAVIERLQEHDHKSWAQVDERMISWARSLHESGVAIAILSNMPVTFYQTILSRFSWIGMFDELIISGMLRQLKPEPEIYRTALSRLRISADQAIFIDDLEPNVAAAGTIGMHALKYTDFASLGRIVSEQYGFDFPAVDG
ncbi:MAG TPA: HAD family phosphatase [Spirochaetia bacterium]|nr:HAD family phosphatase [Spirochaetia bacterium]